MPIIPWNTQCRDVIYFHRWFSLPGSLWTMIVPIVMLTLVWLFYTGLNHHHDRQPFLAALGFFIVSFVGISFYPMILPPTVTIRQAAASDSSLACAMVGAAILILIILHRVWLLGVQRQVGPRCGVSLMTA